jgi:hypothetical protein
MTVGSHGSQNLPFDMAEELKARLRLIDAERAKLVNALKAYQSTPTANGWAGEGLDLDDMSLKDAVFALLTHAAKNGTTEMQAGEIDSTLRNYRVRTSRGGKLISETKSPWMILVRVLTAPNNRVLFHVERASGKHVRRNDKVSLAKSLAPKKDKA